MGVSHTLGGARSPRKGCPRPGASASVERWKCRQSPLRGGVCGALSNGTRCHGEGTQSWEMPGTSEASEWPSVIHRRRMRANGISSRGDCQWCSSALVLGPVHALHPSGIGLPHVLQGGCFWTGCQHRGMLPLATAVRGGAAHEQPVLDCGLWLLGHVACDSVDRRQ